jgi:transcriptional regulator with XRE-family HTH domain
VPRNKVILRGVEKTPRVEQHVGEAIRRLRKEQRLSVRTLASKCGFSGSFISQVELGQASPSIASLERIASGLGITLGEFFLSARSASPLLIRSSERAMLRSQWSRAEIESVAPTMAGNRLEALFITLRPGGSSGSRLHTNETEILAVVFAGEVRLHLQDTAEVLRRGDAISIPTATPHRWENTTKKPAQLLKIIARLVP